VDLRVGARVAVGTSSGRAAAPYAIAFASFAPLNAEIFLAAGNGSEARPFQFYQRVGRRNR
jgi:hypothetical protein